MEYLSPLDASFLDAEDQDPHASLAISSVAVLDGPAPSQDEFTAAIRGRLPLVPRYRQKVRRVPFNLGRPLWVDDPDFDLGFHLRRTALPAPGGDAELANLIGRVMSQRLDRDRPLWEDWVIEGLAGDRWALLSKVHHCMIDGVSGNELYRLICDTGPEPLPPVADEWVPTRAGGDLNLSLDALATLARFPYEQVLLWWNMLRAPAATSHAAGGLAVLAEGFVPATPSPLLGPIGQARRYALTRVPLAKLTETAHKHGVTVNDVYLAAVAGALRRLLLARGEDLDPYTVRTLVPVSMRRADQQNQLDNRLASLLVQLPVELDRPLDRLTAVHERIAELRKAHEVEAVSGIVDLADHEPFAAVSLIIRTALRLPQRALSAVTTNVPGPRKPLYILGRPIREILPYVPIGERMRVGVAAFTYTDQAAFGITTDYASVPEADDLAHWLTVELAALHRARAKRPRSRPGTAAAREPA
ncbi:diacylglycerol O-acyltransferase [Actinoplanes octamycinicus]|uniref:Diacylglycerol O-acyltransferase n=1 Tax=Actinoplanes octamycinicus TaxID=135948 RepID=A0A7W7MAJ0_9ACTN|nr:wax ester/triacylglycerol synthase family O-acyltransferase [Actinoplanes octamycinicus]MBB4742875.1 diacylglycerol O-acyltransferase [Actinoplanes octamycinicus]GIE58272.1 diacylglycerol O-acyltransferase [Actinoplanes octamycinicus]